MTVVKLPFAQSIEGLQLHLSETADPTTHRVEVQYTGPAPTKQWHSLSMSLPDALYLLNLLEEMSRRAGFDHLRHPPSGPAQ